MKDDNQGTTLTEADLGLVEGLGGEPLPDFLAEDALTDEEMEALEADERGDEPQAATEGEAATEGDGDKETAAQAGDETADGEASEGEGGEAAEGAATEEQGKSKVDHGALHAERAKRKEITQERDEWRDKYNKLAGRIDAIEDLHNKAKQADEKKAEADADAEDDDPMPDPDEDIFAYAKWLGRENEKLKAANNKTVQAVTEQQDQNAAAVEQAELVGAYQRSVQEYAAETPDFVAAYNYLTVSQNLELTRLGFADLNERQAELQKQELTIVRNAYKNGENPAAVIYELAEARGYKPAAAPAEDPTDKEDPAKKTEDADAAAAAKAKEAAAAAAAADKTDDKFETARKGSEAAMSLSSAGGTDSNTLTIDALAEMSEAEFEAYYAKHSAEVDRILGEGAN